MKSIVIRILLAVVASVRRLCKRLGAPGSGPFPAVG